MIRQTEWVGFMLALLSFKDTLLESQTNLKMIIFHKKKRIYIESCSPIRGPNVIN